MSSITYPSETVHPPAKLRFSPPKFTAKQRKDLAGLQSRIRGLNERLASIPSSREIVEEAGRLFADGKLEAVQVAPLFALYGLDGGPRDIKNGLAGAVKAALHAAAQGGRELLCTYLSQRADEAKALADRIEEGEREAWTAAGNEPDAFEPTPTLQSVRRRADVEHGRLAAVEAKETLGVGDISPLLELPTDD